jgi:hypothetical protein
MQLDTATPKTAAPLIGVGMPETGMGGANPPII